MHIHDVPEGTNNKQTKEGTERSSSFQLNLLTSGGGGDESGGNRRQCLSASADHRNDEATTHIKPDSNVDFSLSEGNNKNNILWDCLMQRIEQFQNAFFDFFIENRELLKRFLWVILICAFHMILFLSLLHDHKKASGLFAFTLLVWFFFFYKRVLLPVLLNNKKLFGRRLAVFPKRILGSVQAKRVFFALAVGLPLFYILWDARSNPNRLSGLLGLVVFFLLMCLFSHKPTKVNLRPVIWGFLLQFFFGLLVLKWEWGANRFIALSDMAITFLDFTKNGTDFTYGFLSSPPNICGMEPVIAFQVIQTIIYVGAIVAVLYFYGIVQAVLKRMAWLMQITMGTTATESLNACACVLLGNAESPLLIRPYIEKMTASELHAIMTTGFACIAGAVFAAYISFGACPRYLLSGAVMSAPGSLACSKLLYPETEESHVRNVKDLELPPSKENNAMECVSSGSLVAVHVVTAVVANLVSFMALMALLNGLVAYVGSLLGQSHWNLELFFGYAFFPVAYLIGVTEKLEETMIVARLIGVKIVINDFVAYKRLGDVLKEGSLSPRSAMIVTYALCSFSDFIAAGIQMAVLSEMAPTKKRLISNLVLRALFAGCISCFMSAAIAGVLIDEPVACKPRGFDAKCFDLVAHQTFMEKMMSYNISIGSLTESPLHGEL